MHVRSLSSLQLITMCTFTSAVLHADGRLHGCGHPLNAALRSVSVHVPSKGLLSVSNSVLLTAVTLLRTPIHACLLHRPAPALLRDEQAPSPIYHCAFGFAPVRCLRHTDKELVASAPDKGTSPTTP